MAVTCRAAVLSDVRDAADVVALLNEYAQDPMGGGEALSAFAQENLIRELRGRSNAHVFLAHIEGTAVGLAICFEGFSTFACKPLLNIHDFAVSSSYRRRGIGKALMSCVEQFSIDSGCCKVTLEVLEGNHGAKQLYQACGFEGYELMESTGKALMWQKKLH